jgi:hypothetical protein
LRQDSARDNAFGPRRYPREVIPDDADYTDELDDEGAPHAAPAPIERFHRSSLGTMLAAGMFGLRDVLEPPKDETPAIVEDWAGGEPFDDPYVMRLDPENPEDSIVMIRPWLKKPSGTTD